MLGRIILIFGLVLLTSTPVMAQMECHAKFPPRVNIRPIRSNVKYDFTKSRDELNLVQVDTVSPYGAGHATHVSGLMSGAIQLKSNVSFFQETHPYLNQGCLYLKDINVEIHVDPTVYVAKEFPESSCMHNSILTHEYKHIQEDQLIVNKYTNLIGKELGKVIDKWGSTFGPYKKVRINEVQKEVKDALYKAVITMNDDLNQERMKRQQAIDNIQEYKGIEARCKTEITQNNAEIRARLDKIIK